MAKVGVVLSGCGVYDGSEIHEAVVTLLALPYRSSEIRRKPSQNSLVSLRSMQNLYTTLAPDSSNRELRGK